MPLAAAVASAAPLVAGAAASQPGLGAAAALGGLAFLYLPTAGTQRQRSARWLACAAALWACFAFGLWARVATWPAVSALALLLVAGGATAACRWFHVAPPGSVFFVMAAAIGLYVPTPPGAFAAQTIACGAGVLWAVAVGALHLAASSPESAPPPEAPPPVVTLLRESVAVALCTGLATATAEGLGVDRPYWASVCCIAVMQGASRRAVWDRQLQRLAGTAAGLLLAWAVLALPLDRWTLPLAVFAFAFATEMIIVRHYGLAVVCITPLAVLMSEAAAASAVPASTVITARLADTLIGCAVGLLGGLWLHRARTQRPAG